ncbi:MAG: TetR/AcrR family transcriptional regulator, partial [Martelella sp.]
VRDVVALGQGQGKFRRDEHPDFMALVLLAVFGQAMLSALAGDPLTEDGITDIVRIVTEGIGV